LPPPAALHQFNNIIKDGAERIVRMAEMEQQHRMGIERDTLRANIEVQAANIAAQKMEYKAISRGHWIGAVVSALSILAASVTAWNGAHPIVSVAFVGIPLMSVVRAIILRK
jgi:uncharacterized membrane protein